MPVLTLFEHQTRSYTELGITPDDPLIQGLEEINTASRAEVVQLQRKGIRTTQYVGVIRVGKSTLQILPKIDFAPQSDAEGFPGSTPYNLATESATRNLLYLLAYTQDFPIHEVEIASMAAQRSNWFEILTRLLAMDLHRWMQRGIEHNYIRLEEDLPVMRGRWQIERQLRRHPHIQHRFEVAYDEFSPDTPLNRVFRYVVGELLVHTQDSVNRSLLLDLREWLEPVQRLFSVSADQLDRIHFSRLNDRFRPSFNLARLFIEASALQLATGKRETFAFILDMNLLFEAFLAGFIRRHRTRILPPAWDDLQIRVQSEGKTVYLAKRMPDGIPVFRLRPDILFTHLSGAPFLILDTKYKVLDPEQGKRGVSEGDMYQMLAYEVRLDCPRTLVVYPQQRDIHRLRERFQIYASKGEVLAATIDLHRPLNAPEGLVEELMEIFRQFGEGL